MRNQMTLLYPAALASAVLHSFASAQSVPHEGLSAKTDQVMKTAMDAQHLVGLSIAIGEGGGVVCQVNRGFEDREANVAVSNGTMYRWASVSKPMTAVVAMQLVKEKKLDLDADVQKLVPEFPVKPWPVTCRELLCHQGGIVHYSNGKVIKTERTYETPHPFADVVLALDTFKESPLLSEPGTQYSYTTHGYMLLGAAVQRAGGEPFADQVKKRIAAPAGMSTLRPDYQWEAIEHRAVGYKARKAGKPDAASKEPVMERSTDTDVSWKLAGGGWISTCDDMAKFGIAMVTGKLVDEATRQEMWSPQTTRDGKATEYGFGFGVGTLDGARVIHHSGSQEKTATYLLMLPDAKPPVCVAVMCNTEGASLKKLAEDVARLAVSGK